MREDLNSFDSETKGNQTETTVRESVVCMMQNSLNLTK